MSRRRRADRGNLRDDDQLKVLLQWICAQVQIHLLGLTLRADLEKLYKGNRVHAGIHRCAGCGIRSFSGLRFLQNRVLQSCHAAFDIDVVAVEILSADPVAGFPLIQLVICRLIHSLTSFRAKTALTLGSQTAKRVRKRTRKRKKDAENFCVLFCAIFTAAAGSASAAPSRRWRRIPPA